MQFDKSSARRRISRLKNGDDLDKYYKHNLQFYSAPPTETISLQEFEEFAVERLKVLKAVESASIRQIKGTDEYNSNLDKELRKTNFRGIVKNLTNEDNSDQEVRRLDHISHFILRLAYCRSEDLRRWFLQQEMDLFRFRFQNENRESIQRFLELNNLNYKPIPDNEKKEYSAELAAAANTAVTSVETVEYFKVPFTEALDLVKGRKVYVHRGLAFVPQSDLIVIILTAYRTHLSHQLAVTARALPHLEEDDRLLPMLCGLSKRYLGKDYTNKKPTAGQITADMIDLLSKKSFPLCMQNLHQNLRQQHHLRHGGRMQYGLFLKGTGISLEEALKFWRAEFTKMMDVDKFEKQYAYNIRHSFGKEGKRTDYTPFSCMKIIMGNMPGPGDSHGCPFRHFDADLLRQRLRGMSISKDGTDKIMEYVKGHHYQVACVRYFELVHNIGESSLSFNHPNEYFEESQKILNGSKDGASPLPPRTPKTPRVYNRSSQNTPTSQNMSTSISAAGSQNTPTSNSAAGSQNTPTSHNANGSQVSDPLSQPVPTQLSDITEMDDDFAISAEEMDQVMQDADI